MRNTNNTENTNSVLATCEVPCTLVRNNIPYHRYKVYGTTDQTNEGFIHTLHVVTPVTEIQYAVETKNPMQVAHILNHTKSGLILVESQESVMFEGFKYRRVLEEELCA